MKENRQTSAQPLISTRLQPGVDGRRVSLAASAASRARGKAVKTAGNSLGRRITGLKPGVNERKYLEIIEATYVSGHKLRLEFNDGKKRVMDFGPFLRQARNPMTTQYRQLRKFKSFHLHYGDLVWGDYQMIFPIMDLYQGTILKGESLTPSHLVLSETTFPATSASGRKAKQVSYKKLNRKKN
jgi:hypothetical protein